MSQNPIKSIYYLITLAPDDDNFVSVINTIKSDLANGFKVVECFFYSDGCKIISDSLANDTNNHEISQSTQQNQISQTSQINNYISEIENLSEQYQFKLSVCAAAIKARNYKLREFADDNFDFMSLAQFIAKTNSCKSLRIKSF